MQLLTNCLVVCLLVATSSAIMEFGQTFGDQLVQICLDANQHVSNVTQSALKCDRFLGEYFNLTTSQVNTYLSLQRESHDFFSENKRQKRHLGLRIRRECRTLSEHDRNRLFDAIVHLKRGPERTYDIFAKILNNPSILTRINFGSNFYGWLRVIMFYFENALRRVAPGVALCYWDTSLDNSMPGVEQLSSVTFSNKMFGNGYGVVINGPFRNWRLTKPLNFRLRRNIGQRGSLIRARTVDRILYDPRIRHQTQITAGKNSIGFPDPDNGRRQSLEEVHYNIHVFLGEFVNSIEDPIGWFFHCYVDYIWELFRVKQKKLGIDPSKDYPENGDEAHRAGKRMVPFFNFRNIDGYSNVFTDRIYRYAPHPTCGNRCGGASKEFLYCPKGGHRRTRCLPRSSNRDHVPPLVLKEISNPMLEVNVKKGIASRAVLNAMTHEIAMKEGPVRYPKVYTITYDDPRIFVG